MHILIYVSMIHASMHKYIHICMDAKYVIILSYYIPEDKYNIHPIEHEEQKVQQ